MTRTHQPHVGHLALTVPTTRLVDVTVVKFQTVTHGPLAGRHTVTIGANLWAVPEDRKASEFAADLLAAR